MAPLAKMTTNGNFGLRIDDLTTVINGEKLSALPFSATNGHKWPKMAKNGSKIDGLTTATNGKKCQPCHFRPQMAKNGQIGSKIDNLTTVTNGKKCQPCHFRPQMAKNGRGILRR
ncbi:hypothetical protein [Pseudomonas syringae]|uniref:hypothetical protein n=1 Tax=Pseudomonas syringae TaxID=317 RepID=UPI000A3DFF3C|nr:hypothetical protein [Pseudomonas syringae]